MAPSILQGMVLNRNQSSNSNSNVSNNNNIDHTTQQRQRKHRIRSLRDRSRSNHPYSHQSDNDESSNNNNNNNSNNSTSFFSSSSSNNHSFDTTPFASFDEFYHDNRISNEHNGKNTSIAAEHEFKHHERNWDWDATAKDDEQQQQQQPSTSHPPSNKSTQNDHDRTITSPTTLQAFDYSRRQTKKSIQPNNHKINHHHHHHTPDYQPYPKTNMSIDELPNPKKLIDQVRFRNRFASAAMVSKKIHSHNNDDEEDQNQIPQHLFKKDNGDDMNTSFSEEVHVPTQLFFPTTHRNSNEHRGNNRNHHERQSSSVKSSRNTEWPISIHFDAHDKNNNLTIPTSSPPSKSTSYPHEYSNEWPPVIMSSSSPSPHNNNHHDESYESFGNQSVFSDITGSVGMPSPARESVKKKKHSNGPYSNDFHSRSNHHHQQQHSKSIFRGDLVLKNKHEPLFEVHYEEEEENEDGMMEYHKDNDKLHAVNKTASTMHLSMEEEEQQQQETEEYSHRTPNSSFMDINKHGDSSSTMNNSKKSKMQSRLASLFTTRALHYNHHQSNTLEEKQRSKSAPKPRYDQTTSTTHYAQNSNHNRSYEYPQLYDESIYRQKNHIDRIMDSPVRSNTSGSSSGYVGWPGTIGKDGTTVAITSSFSDDGGKHFTFDPTANSSMTKLENQAMVSNEESRVDLDYENKKRIVNNVNKTENSIETKDEKSKLKMGFGRNRFDWKQRQGIFNKETKAEDNVSTRVSDLKQRYESDVVDLDEVPASDTEDEAPQITKKEKKEKPKTQNAADIYLAKAVSRARSPSSSPVNVPEQDLNQSFPGAANAPPRSNFQDVISPQKARSLRHRDKPCLQLDIVNMNKTKDADAVQDCGESSNHQENIIDVSASLRRVRTAMSPETLVSIPEDEDGFRLSEEALRRNEQLSPVRSNASGANVRGFRGFLDKTKDVPNLMDDESDSCTTASTMTSEQKMIRRTEIGNWKPPSVSDVFDGMSTNSEQASNSNRQKLRSSPPFGNRKLIRPTSMKFNKPKIDEENINVVQNNPFSRQNSHLTSRCTSPSDASENGSESRYVSSLNSLYSGEENCATELNLLNYAIDPKKSRKMVKYFRNMSNALLKASDDPYVIEDSKKAFALFEMRSRIMETDIERGLDRKGGTTTVDDIVLTSYYQASYRVRDAVIVSKAWREGASPSDARTAYNLTRGENCYILNRDSVPNLSAVGFGSRNRFFNNQVWEKVLWIDDSEFSQIRCPCPSLNGGFNRGADIFTLGDCQSILLKLTNEYCEVSSQTGKLTNSNDQFLCIPFS